MVEVPLPKPKLKKPAPPIGVMPNYVYNKAQFNNLQIRKDIDKFLDPVAKLGWHLYTTGQLEIRNVNVPKHLSVNVGGTYYDPERQKRHDTLTGEVVTSDATFEGKLSIDRPFKSPPNIPKIVIYRNNQREERGVYAEHLTLVHELRHAGLDYLNNLIQGDEHKQVRDYTPKYQSKKFLKYKDPQKTEHKEVDYTLELFNSLYKQMSQSQNAEESLFTIMDFYNLKNQEDLKHFDEFGKERDTISMELHPAYKQFEQFSSYANALELYAMGASQEDKKKFDSKDFFTASEKKSFYQNFPKEIYTPNKRQYPKYEAARIWKQEVDSQIKTLNDAAIKQLNILKGKKTVKEKPIVPKKDVGVIKKFMNLLFSQKQPSNLDTQMKALKVG